MPTWEYVAGPEGVVTLASEVDRSIAGLTVSLDYVDDPTPPFTECWGSDGMYGAAATVFAGGLPNTDPRSTPFDSFQAHRVLSMWPANLGAAAWTPNWASNALEPLDVEVLAYS